jgi:hypothetical protein
MGLTRSIGHIEIGMVRFFDHDPVSNRLAARSTLLSDT